MATGSRGGFATSLLAGNLLSNPMPQPSLSEGLRLGVAGAHRQQVHGGPEFRNYRRSTPMGRKHRHGGAQ
jgi:hypothetical protein